MKESKEEKRARMMAKAAEAIDQYLEWEEKHPRPDLTQIEDIALKLRKEFGQAIAQMAIANQAARAPVPGPACRRCGKEMRYKGKKKIEVESRAGNLEVERGYYYCDECGESIFPPGWATSSA